MNVNSAAVTKLANCRIVDTEAGCVTAEVKDVFLRGERIIAVCTAGESRRQADSTVDVKGMYVIPGMINTHCHNTYITPAILADGKTVALTKKHKVEQIRFNMKSCIEYGITTIRDALSDDLAGITTLRKMIDAGDLIGPAIHASVLISHAKGACVQPKSFWGRLMLRMIGVPLLDYSAGGTGIVLLPENAGADDMKNAVDEAVRRGADFIKVYDQREKMLTYKPGADVLTGRELCATTGFCREKKVRTLMHQLTAESFVTACSMGIDSVAHLPVDRRLTEEEIAFVKNSDIMIEPTLSLAYYYCWMHGDSSGDTGLAELSEYRRDTCQLLVDKYWIAELRNSVAGNFSKAARQHFKTFGGLNMLPFFAYMDNYVSTGFDNLIALLKAGCEDKISFGNDAGATQCSPATKDTEIDLLRECCRSSGMNMRQTNKFILKVFTLNGAKALGKEKKIGRIRDGYMADIAVYKRNPLDDIDVIKGKTILTIAGGKVYETG